MSKTIDSESPRLSIIVHARNEAQSLPASLEKIACYLTETDFDAEVIVVDNGSTDGIRDVVRDFSSHHQSLQIRFVVEPCLKKDAAAITGISQGTGDILFLCDAGLSSRIKELKQFLKRLANRRDVARNCRGGIRTISEPIHHWLTSFFLYRLAKTFGMAGYAGYSVRH